MGTIVGAFAMSHQLGAPDGIEDQVERVFEGMKEVGRRIRALDPDLIVIVTSDHLNNFSLATPAPFAVGTAAEFTPYGDMGLPRDPVAGSPEFAKGLRTFAQRRGIAVAEVNPLAPDHGVMIPLGIVDPARAIPSVPLYVNTVFYPEPTPAQSWELGGTLRDYIAEAWPEGSRIVLLGGGGLSHWVGVAGEGTVNEAWDRDFLDDAVHVRGEKLAARDNADILAAGGNGGLEIAAWIAVMGAIPGARGECLFYEPVPQWATGMAGMEWRLHA